MLAADCQARGRLLLPLLPGYGGTASLGRASTQASCPVRDVADSTTRRYRGPLGVRLGHSHRGVPGRARNTGLEAHKECRHLRQNRQGDRLFPSHDLPILRSVHCLGQVHVGH